MIVAHAQTKADEDAVRAIPRSMCDAWAKHDAHEMAKFMAEDVDFVTVGATWFHGRSDYEKYHTRLLSGRFKESKNTVLETMVRFCVRISPCFILAGRLKEIRIQMVPLVRSGSGL